MKKIVAIFALLFVSNLIAQVDTPAVKKVVYPNGYTEKIDAVYSETGDWKGREDIYYNPTAATPTPIIFNIHGGGWNHGVKEGQGGFSSFFKMGYAVANIEYRLTPQATAPAAIEDVRAAILYVVQHAKELNINPNKIVVMGGSAGGHLALMAGLLQNDNTFDGAYKKTTKYTIAAIINKYGIADVWDWAYGPNIRSKSAINWLGAKAKDEAFAMSVSPIFYVKKTSPPTFIVHGDADPTVPYQQSVELKKKYDEVGCKNEFMTIVGGKHGGFKKDKNTEMTAAIIAFLKTIEALK